MTGIRLNPLVVKYRMSPDFPSYASHRYLHEEQVGREDLNALDVDNRRAMDAYIKNIHTMERLTIIHTNLNLLKRNQGWYEADETGKIEVEVVGVRVGAFVLVTFPGELSVEIGLGIKERSPHDLTFVAGRDQRLHLLHTHGEAAGEPGQRAGGQRLPCGGGMAEAV